MALATLAPFAGISGRKTNPRSEACTAKVTAGVKSKLQQQADELRKPLSEHLADILTRHLVASGLTAD